MKLIFASMLASAVTGCVTPEPEREIPGCTSMECVAIGEAQQIGQYEGDLVVIPLEILEDSRCPIEADCIWEGRVRLKSELRIGHEIVTLELTTEEPLRIKGGMLSVGEVAPEVSSQWMPLEPEDYRFGFGFAPDIMDGQIPPQ